MVVYVDKCDMVDDDELLDLIESTFREKLFNYGIGAVQSIIR